MPGLPHIGRDHPVAAPTGLDAFFRPRAIAVIGASADFTKMPGRPVEYLIRHGYPGRVYPVNPRHETIRGLKCYPSVAELPDGVDLALIAVAAEQVPGVVRDCAAKGVQAVTILSGGFSESPEPRGTELEDELKRIAAQTGIRICGPNAQGGANVFDRVPATYTIAVDRAELVPGPVALVTQSGVFGGLIFAAAQDSRLGIGYCVSTGNETDIGFSECLAYVARDPRIRVIAGYIESIKDSAEEFLDALQVASELDKPVVVLKTGRTDRGQSAAASHTGALASADEGYQATFRRTGVIRAADGTELRDLVAAFSAGRLPVGPRVAIASMSGGAGTLMTDQCVEHGLEVVPAFAEGTLTRLRQILPPVAALTNPIDVTGQMIAQPALLADTATILAEDEGVDMVLVFLGMCHAIQKPLMDHLEQAYRATGKPLLITWIAGDPAVYSTLRSRGIPVFEDPRGCVRAAAGLVERARFRARSAKEEGPRNGNGDVRGTSADEVRRRLQAAPPAMSEHDAKEILRQLGFPVPAGRLVSGCADAIAAAGQIGWPVALKLQGGALRHKSEIGAVRLNLATSSELTREFEALEAIAPAEAESARVEAMSPEGVEVIVGAKRHPIFGPLVMVGLGGIFVEIYRDVATRLAPVTPEEAREMIEELRAYPILAGARGRAPADIDALARLVADLSRFAAACAGSVSEMDFNPVRVFEAGRGAIILDALIIKD